MGNGIMKKMAKHLKDIYNIGWVTSWKAYGIPAKYRNIISSYGFIDEYGSVEEFLSGKEQYEKYRKKLNRN